MGEAGRGREPSNPLPPPLPVGSMNGWSKRPVPDLIILMFGAVLAIVVPLSVIALIIIEIVEPEVDLSTPIAALGNIITALIVAVFSYLAGRGVSARRGDSENHSGPDSKE